MSAPTIATPDVQSAEPQGNVHDDAVVFVNYVPSQPRKRAWWETFFIGAGIIACTFLVAALVIYAPLWLKSSSYTQYDDYSSPQYDSPSGFKSYGPSHSCSAGDTEDGRGICHPADAYAAVQATSEKKFKAWMKSGKIDFKRWVEKKGLKPALSSSSETVTLSYLCSAKPTQDGRLYAANSLGVKDDIGTFFVSGDISVIVGWNSAAEIAQDWCPKVPSWAKPKPSLSVPKALTPPRSVNVMPAPDDAGYGG